MKRVLENMSFSCWVVAFRAADSFSSFFVRQWNPFFADPSNCLKTERGPPVGPPPRQNGTLGQWPVGNILNDRIGTRGKAKGKPWFLPVKERRSPGLSPFVQFWDRITEDEMQMQPKCQPQVRSSNVFKGKSREQP